MRVQEREDTITELTGRTIPALETEVRTLRAQLERADRVGVVAAVGRHETRGVQPAELFAECGAERRREGVVNDRKARLL